MCCAHYVFFIDIASDEEVTADRGVRTCLAYELCRKEKSNKPCSQTNLSQSYITKS